MRSLLEGGAADNDMFHFRGLRNDPGAGVVVLTVPHVDRDVVFFGELDGAGLQDTRADGGKLHHFVIADAVDLAGVGDDAGVGGVDAVDVGVVFADFGVKGGAEGDEGGVGPAAAEGGDVAVFGDALGSRRR